MKRAEWPSSQKPREMLYALLKAKKSGRKIRLFACACCRSVWHLLSDLRSRQGVETSEDFADELVTDTQAFEAYNAAAAAYQEAFPSGSGSMDGEDERGVSQANLEAAQAVPVTLLSYETPEHAQRHATIVSCYTITAASLAEAQAHPVGPIADYTSTTAEAGESSAQANWLRCIFGNPFRRLSIKQSCCTPTVVALAQGAYENRSLPTGNLEKSRLAILADALEEAGCTDADILSHCRESGPHVRGCWVVDLLLQKA